MNPNKNRGWQRVLLIIIPYIIIAGVFQFLGMLIAGVDFLNPASPKSSGQELIVSIFNLAGTFLVLWLFMKFVDKEKLIELGYSIKNRLKEFNTGLLFGTLMIVVAFLILIGLNEIKVVEVVFNLREILISIVVFTIVAFVEESLVRGYILRNLMFSFNKYLALFISAIIFSLIHAANPNINLISLVNLFLAGILLGITYIHTKNLWFPIALHFSWNLVQTHLGFNVSGQEFYSIIESSNAESNILNGGDFGFEGSVLSLILQVILIVGIELYYRKKQASAIKA